MVEVLPCSGCFITCMVRTSPQLSWIARSGLAPVPGCQGFCGVVPNGSAGSFVSFNITSVWYATSIVHMRICAVCDSTLFCFRKLKPRRLPTLTKENVIFDSKLSPGYFSVAGGAKVDAHDWNQRNWKGNILKSDRDKPADFCGTCHGKSFFQFVVTLCRLQFF